MNIKSKKEHTIRESISKTIIAIGDDIERYGLTETPNRVSKFLLDTLSGYIEDPNDFLNYNAIIIY